MPSAQEGMGREKILSCKKVRDIDVKISCAGHRVKWYTHYKGCVKQWDDAARDYIQDYLQDYRPHYDPV